MNEWPMNFIKEKKIRYLCRGRKKKQGYKIKRDSNGTQWDHLRMVLSSVDKFLKYAKVQYDQIVKLKNDKARYDKLSFFFIKLFFWDMLKKTNALSLLPKVFKYGTFQQCNVLRQLNCNQLANTRQPKLKVKFRLLDLCDLIEH